MRAAMAVHVLGHISKAITHINIQHHYILIGNTDQPFRRQTAVNQQLLVDNAIPEDIGKTTAHPVLRQLKSFEVQAIRGRAATREPVTVDVDSFRERVKIRLSRPLGLIGREKARNDDIRRIIVTNIIVEDLNQIIGVDQYA